MQFLQLSLIFVVLICLTIIVFKIIGFLLPLILCLIEIIFIGAIIVLFGTLFYNLLKG